VRILYRYVPTSVLSEEGNSRECQKGAGREEEEDARTRSVHHAGIIRGYARIPGSQ